MQITSLIEKINGGNNPFFKELYGSDAVVLKAQADRYIKYINEFKSIYGNDDVMLLSSPGRSEVGGISTVVAKAYTRFCGQKSKLQLTNNSITSH